MQFAFQKLAILILSTIIIVPMGTFQKCCCDGANSTDRTASCCAQANKLARSNSGLQGGDHAPSGKPHRCPCVKQNTQHAVPTERAEPSLPQQDLLLAIVPRRIESATTVVATDRRFRHRTSIASCSTASGAFDTPVPLRIDATNAMKSFCRTRLSSPSMLRCGLDLSMMDPFTPSSHLPIQFKLN